MSTSLNKDLHSVYIDGEMPESFVSQYESIVNSDEKEKNRLERMQVLHSLLQEDSKSKTVSDDFVNASFERLQTKMRYAKNTGYANSASSSSFVRPFAKYVASFAAAAAVFAVIFVPVHTNSLRNAKETAVAAIKIMKQNSIEPIAQKDVIVNGDIDLATTNKVLAKSSPVSNSQAKSNISADLSANIPATSTMSSASPSIPQYEQKTIAASSLVSGGRRNRGRAIERQLREQLTAADPFIPDFSSGPIQITISIPNFREINSTNTVPNLEMMKNQE